MSDRLKEILPKERILTEEPMDRHTTFRTGGPARYFLVIETRKELAQVLAWLQEEALPWFLLGNGSNLLVGDQGYRGAILHLAGEFLKTEIDETTIRCGAGAMLSAVSRSAMEAGLTGLEFASGIPGTIGGAVRMNAGAYGGEIAGVTESVEVMEPDGSCRVYNREEMAFGYRTSIVKTKPCVVLSTVLKLQKGDRSEISATMQELSAKRREKQPLEYPSAGSTFKRPEGYFAGKLIMDAGLAGASVGDAQVSEKHCGFVINRKNATSADVAGLIQKVTETVQEKFGVTLEPEVIFLGDFEK